MKFIKNRFKTKCAETLRIIMPGEIIFLSNGLAYCMHSKKYAEAFEAENIKNYIQAQEDAYFDKLTQYCRK
jgi:hypothetical protein